VTYPTSTSRHARPGHLRAGGDSPDPADSPDSPAPSDLADRRLGPATRLLWRERDAVQLELGDAAVIFEGVAPEVVVAVTRRGSAPASLPLDPPAADAVAGLTDAGFLWPREEGSADERDPYLAAPAPRLARELVGLSARNGARAAAVLNHRRHRSVTVCGSAGAAIQLTAVLAAAGVGQARCVPEGTARLADVLPGGITCADEGRSMAAASAGAVARVAPDMGDPPAPGVLARERVDDLTVLLVDGPVDDDRRGALHASQAPHLLVEFGVDQGSVGPLVLPGLTSCLRCADLHRRDRDPAWPVLAVQLAVAARRGSRCGTALVSLVTAIAAIQVLAFLDGEEPAVVDGSLEIRLPDWRVRRRTRRPHPDCDCAPPE
jgi:bacteriocin biosynthesis cyclodehydratase domain-containing protein